MSSTLPYLIRMLLFLGAVMGLAVTLHQDLVRVFLNTPVLNSVILGVLIIGIFFIFRQIILMRPEIEWMRRYQHRDPAAPPPSAESVNLLAPMAAMLGERHDEIRLSPTASRAVLDGIATRLDERRELARYLIGLLIFLGLLGTFWGLLETIGAVADAINSLQVTAGDPLQMFAKLKGSIEGPLKGMATAFGASLFGLSGSLVLGFLELQASQAQGRFHTELEEWLARATSLSTAGVRQDAVHSLPAYVEALLERNTEGVDGLVRALQRVEESRQSTAASNATLVERLAALAETMRTQQSTLARFTELSIELRGAVAQLSERSAASEDDRAASLAHQANVEALLTRLVDESVHSRDALLDHQRDIESKIVQIGEATAASATERHRIADGLGALLGEREAAQLHRQTLESQLQHTLSRVLDENARNRGALAEEMKAAVRHLAERFADVDRDSIAAHQRKIEAHLARLMEESEVSRTSLADELRGEIRLLARTIALARAPANEPPAAG
ncbi:MAG: flagellar motor protein MotA [Enhydrobacter sp.]|nr:flagellar motor protein MotA [Enhydrobacter sp.]